MSYTSSHDAGRNRNRPNAVVLASIVIRSELLGRFHGCSQQRRGDASGIHHADPLDGDDALHGADEYESALLSPPMAKLDVHSSGLPLVQGANVAQYNSTSLAHRRR
jgi:hypothetical protein